MICKGHKKCNSMGHYCHHSTKHEKIDSCMTLCDGYKCVDDIKKERKKKLRKING